MDKSSNCTQFWTFILQLLSNNHAFIVQAENHKVAGTTYSPNKTLQPPPTASSSKTKYTAPELADASLRADLT